MGLDKNLKTPCGFCFVEYHNRPDAERAVKYLNGTKLDDREVRMDFDWGFQEGGSLAAGSGGQVPTSTAPPTTRAAAGTASCSRPSWTRCRTRRRRARRARATAASAGPPPPTPTPRRRRRRPGAQVGAKRGREEEEDDEAPAKSNPRFRGDESDED